VVDETPQRQGIGLVANVPVCHPGELPEAVIAPTPPDHGDIYLVQCAVAHQLTPIGRWIEQRGDLGFGQVLSAHQPCLPGDKTGRPADPGRGVDECAASDAEYAANRGLGCTVVERSQTRYPWRIPAARRQSVLSLSAYATKIGRSLVPAKVVMENRPFVKSFPMAKHFRGPSWDHMVAKGREQSAAPNKKGWV
jgi:hypothetical protein